MFLDWFQLHKKRVSILIYVCIMDLLGTRILVLVDKDNRIVLRNLIS